MNEIVLPLYLALACIFVGLTVAGLPSRDMVVLPGERSSIWGVVGGVSASLACICIALVPVVGRPLLLGSTALLWLSFQATALRVRSWHTVPDWRLSILRVSAVGLAILLMLALVAAEVETHWRVIYQLLVSEVLLGLMMLELTRVARKGSSLQLHMMRWNTLGIMLLLCFWSWVVISADTRATMIRFSPLLSEASLAFAMRLFLVAMLVLLLVSANGFALEKMAALKSQARAQRDEAESLNTRLQEILRQKNDLLQTMAFTARSQNLPVIMSSLSHEINQPLGAIRLTAEHLMAEDEVLPPAERKQMLRNLALGSVAATQVLRDFRRFFEINLTPVSRVDLQPLLADLDRALQADFQRYQVQMHWSCHASVQVPGDPLQLETLLTGVLQFMLSRTGIRGRHLTVTCELAPRKLVIHVCDDGPELEQEVLDEAFLRAHPVSGSRLTHGLWLSRAIAEHYGGTLQRLMGDAGPGLAIHLPLLEDLNHER